MLQEHFGTTAGVEVSLLKRVLAWAVWPTATGFVAPGAFQANLGRAVKPVGVETCEPSPSPAPEELSGVNTGPKWQRPTPRWFIVVAFIWVNLNFFA